MQQRFQPLFFPGVAEDDPGDGAAVNGAVRRNHVGAPPFSQLTYNIGPAKNLAIELVRIDQQTAEPLKLTRNGRLPRADTPA